MLNEIIQNNQGEKGVILLKEEGVLQSVFPADYAFGLTYHFAMIPYCNPKSVLMLGYGLGTIPELIRRVWGDTFKIMCVDISPIQPKYIEYAYKIGDAEKFVEECNRGIIKQKFDFVLIDVFHGGHCEDFVFDKGFAKTVFKITNKACYINTTKEEMPALKGFENAGFNCEKERVVMVGNNIVTLWTK